MGKSQHPAKRLRQHLNPALLKARNHRENWVSCLLALGLRPVMEVVDWVPDGEWKAAERHYIREFLDMGARLTNSTAGGDAPIISGEQNKAHRIKRKLSKAYTDFLKSGRKDFAARLAAKLRGAYAMRPNRMPESWRTIGLDA